LALEGRLTAHHRLMLQIYKDSICDKERQIKRLDTEIEKAAKEYQVEIDLLQTIPGVGKDSAISIISETGVDMGEYPDEHHLSSLSGIALGNNESGGKKTAKMVHGNAHLQCTLVECAWRATRKKDGYLKRKYESLVGRGSKKKALVAVGHKIIIAVYHVIRDKQSYKEPKLHDNPKKQNKQIRNYMNRLKELRVDTGVLEQKIQEGRFLRVLTIDRFFYIFAKNISMDNNTCKRCASDQYIMNGKVRFQQCYKCKNCGYNFIFWR